MITKSLKKILVILFSDTLEGFDLDPFGHVVDYDNAKLKAIEGPREWFDQINSLYCKGYRRQN